MSTCPTHTTQVKKLAEEAVHTGKIAGIVKVREYDKDGRLVCEREDRNLITNGIKDVLGELLVQDFLGGARTTAQLKIDSIKMGTSNVTPARTQTALQSAPAVTKTLAAVNVARPSTGTYTFTVTMDTSEGNGNTFREVGLFTQDGTMIARQVHADTAKDATKSLEYIWTLIFS